MYNLLSARNVSLNALFTHETFNTPFSKLIVLGSWLKAIFVTMRGRSNNIVRAHFIAGHEQNVARVSYQLAGQVRDLERGLLLAGHEMVMDGVRLRLRKNKLMIRHPFWLIEARSSDAAPHRGVARLDIKIRPMYAVDKDAVAPQCVQRVSNLA